MKKNMNVFLADQMRKRCYLCARIPDDRTRFDLAWGDGLPPLSVWLTRLSEDELLIEPSESDTVGLNEVYDYFRQQEMTFEEMWKAAVYVDPTKDYERKVRSLSVTEGELFKAASEEVSMRGEALAKNAGHEISGQTKGNLTLLVKLGLLQKGKGGYLRAPFPLHPYFRLTSQ